MIFSRTCKSVASESDFPKLDPHKIEYCFRGRKRYAFSSLNMVTIFFCGQAYNFLKSTTALHSTAVCSCFLASLSVDRILRSHFLIKITVTNLNPPRVIFVIDIPLLAVERHEGLQFGYSLLVVKRFGQFPAVWNFVNSFFIHFRRLAAVLISSF